MSAQEKRTFIGGQIKGGGSEEGEKITGRVSFRSLTRRCGTCGGHPVLTHIGAIVGVTE